MVRLWRQSGEGEVLSTAVGTVLLTVTGAESDDPAPVPLKQNRPPGRRRNQQGRFLGIGSFRTDFLGTVPRF